MQSITIQLPDKLYQQLQHQAHQRNRAVEEEITAVVEATIFAANDWSGIPSDTVEQVNQLQFLSDKHLWQAAKLTVAESKSERMQALILKMQDEGLTEAEQAEAAQLQQLANRVMLIRAEAAVLLQKRNRASNDSGIAP